MTKEIFITSNDENFSYPYCYNSIEDAIKHGFPKRIIKVNIEIPIVMTESSYEEVELSTSV